MYDFSTLLLGNIPQRLLTDVDQVKSIDILPDDVLLEIFDFCGEAPFSKKEIEAWQILVHVCRRWRSVVFRSSHRLDLQLVCTAKTPARDTLNVWPALPIFIRCHGDHPIESVDNIVAVLERSNRVCLIELLDISSIQLEKVSAAMQEPFPELANLNIRSQDEMAPVVPDSLLGGSAPCLELLQLHGIPFPGLPRLLLSATHLINLRLENIPHSGYFSPEAMVTALSALISLGSLKLEFQSPQSHPAWVHRRPPPIRSVLPVLTLLTFKGVTEYLDDLVARIDAPQLDTLYITLFNQIFFDTPHLIQFVSRTPKLKAFEEAHLTFGDDANISLSSPTSEYRGSLSVKIPCRELDWQVSSLEQVCNSCLPRFPALDGLYICEALYSYPVWQDNIDDTLWLDLLRPFAAVKKLYLTEEFARRIAPALGELIGGGTTDVLPTLENLFLEGLEPSGPDQEGIGKFVATRQDTDRPIAISSWSPGPQDDDD